MRLHRASEISELELLKQNHHEDVKRSTQDLLEEIGRLKHEHADAMAKGDNEEPATPRTNESRAHIEQLERQHSKQLKEMMRAHREEIQQLEQEMMRLKQSNAE